MCDSLNNSVGAKHAALGEIISCVIWLQIFDVAEAIFKMSGDGSVIRRYSQMFLVSRTGGRR